MFSVLIDTTLVLGARRYREKEGLLTADEACLRVKTTARPPASGIRRPGVCCEAFIGLGSRCDVLRGRLTEQRRDFSEEVHDEGLERRAKSRRLNNHGGSAMLPSCVRVCITAFVLHFEAAIAAPPCLRTLIDSTFDC